MSARTWAARAQYLGARVAARLPDGVKVRLSGEPPVVLDGQRLDAQVQLLRSLRRRRGAPGLVEPTVAIGRARFRAETAFFRGPVTAVASVRDLEAPGPAGPLRLRHYAPPADAPQPLTVYLHGGGFVIGDLDTHDEPCRMLCRHAGVHVLSVEYRLAPEHPFPAAVEDACAALGWARENARALGADPSRVAVGGDSAGANLSAVAAALAARAGAAPRAQLLIYPPTDAASTGARPSHALFGEGFFLTQRDREAFILAYLGGDQGACHDARVSPLRAPDLTGLPPALVATAGFDLLRDEGEAYAQALSAAGVHTRSRRFEGLGHGFIHLTGVCPAARRAVMQTAREWRELLDATGANA